MMITSVYVERDGKFVLLGQCAPLAHQTGQTHIKISEPGPPLHRRSPVPVSLRFYLGQIKHYRHGGMEIPILVIGGEDDPHWIPGFIWRKDVRDVQHGDV